MRQQARNETNDIDKINVDSRFHGNDKKTNRQSPVIASPDKSGRSNLKKMRHTFGEYVKTVGANNYLPLQ
jgi:hypothetical protein